MEIAVKKVAELEGVELDCWVAKALDPAEKVYQHGDSFCIRWQRTPPRYSSDWAIGGPVIEASSMTVGTSTSDETAWRASFRLGECKAWGPTPLVAAMRCRVVSVFGEEVQHDQPAAVVA